ncbi:MAG: hypothetical protein HC822_03465 [Oscillochloris sp.]|nr:hypothetical protein [Oscillochloris sp.]
MKRSIVRFALLCFVLLAGMPRSTAAAGFTTSAAATPASAAPGTELALTVTVRSDSAMSLLVDLEIYAPNGEKVGQKWWDNQSFSAGQQRSLQTTWQIPANAASGDYTLKIGLFSPGWGTMYHWNNSAGSLSVGGAGNDANGLRAQYFNNTNFSGSTITRDDTRVDFNWGAGSPDSTIGADTFSVRWEGQVEPRYSERYTFYTVSDDGVRLWVNGKKVIDNWTRHAPTENQGRITLQAGQRYDIRLEFFESSGRAQISLAWSSPSQPKQIIPQNQLFLPIVTNPPATPQPTATATTQPTAQPTNMPTPVPPTPVLPTPTTEPEARYFSTLPPGSQLPSEAECAAMVKPGRRRRA